MKNQNMGPHVTQPNHPVLHGRVSCSPPQPCRSSSAPLSTTYSEGPGSLNLAHITIVGSLYASIQIATLLFNVGDRNDWKLKTKMHFGHVPILNEEFNLQIYTNKNKYYKQTLKTVNDHLYWAEMKDLSM